VCVCIVSVSSSRTACFFNEKLSLLVAQIEENKAEVSRLRRLHLNQQQHAQTARMINWETGMEQMANPNINQSRMQGKISSNN
jgi:hypothetical protein